MMIGVLDVGTNSIHVLIGELDRRGGVRVRLKAQELAQLGEGGLVRGRLTMAAQRRAFRVLARYAAILTRWNVDRIEAVATSAVREAENGAGFVRQVRRRLHVPLRVISGREEARLNYLGAWTAHRFRSPAAFIAIGGGSAQVVCAASGRLRYARSVPLGSARLAQQFLRHDPPRPNELAALTEHLRGAWKPVAKAVRRHRCRVALGGSAMIRQLLLASYWRARRRLPADEARLSIHRRTLAEIVAWLSSSTARERVRMRGLDPRREHLVLPTSLALLTWMDACGVPAIRYAPGSIREGLLRRYDETFTRMSAV